MNHKRTLISIAMATIVLVSMVVVASAATPAITSVTTAPAVVWTGGHHEFFFIQGDNGNLWGMTPGGRIEGGQPGTWTDVGVAITSSPYAVAASTQDRQAWNDPNSGIVTVFFTTASGGIASTTTTDSGGAWSALTSWPGTVAAGTGPAAVVNPATHSFDVFYVDSSSLHLMEDSLQVNIIPPASSVVTDLGGVVTATPAVVSPVNGFVDVVVRGTGGHIWERTFETGGSPWTEFHDGTIGYGAAMVNPGGTSVTLFVAGSDYRLYELQSTDNGVSWHVGSHNNLAWTNLGGFLTSQPSASLYQDHAPSSLSAPLKVAVAGTNSNIWQWTTPPGTWSTTSTARP